MGCNCSSDYSDSEWIENLDEICEHCNCPIAPQSCNPVSVYTHFLYDVFWVFFFFCLTGAARFTLWCVNDIDMGGFWLFVWLNVSDPTIKIYTRKYTRCFQLSERVCAHFPQFISICVN